MRRAWAILVLLSGSLSAQNGPAELTARFEKEIRPLLESHCAKCHGPQKKKGDIDFSKAVLRDRKVWKKALLQIEAVEMPPEGEKRLTAEQRDALLGWLRGAAAYVDCSNPAERHPGPPVLRRLNRTEYTATVRDLTGVTFDVSAEVGMPEEATGTAFDTSANALVLPPALLEKHFSAAEIILDRMKPLKGESPRATVAAFARRAFRRPPADDEIDRLMSLYDRAASRGDAPAKALRLPLKAILVSPHFLFRVERDQPGTGPYRVRDHELATRLSYFLWSTMPDEALSADAEKGALSDPAVLEGHVRRMLVHPKARALTLNFAAQWLQLRKLDYARPSTEFFPTFNNKLSRRCATRRRRSPTSSARKTGACSTCSTAITRGSTGIWRSTTRSRASRGRTSGGSRSGRSTTGADCSAWARSSRSRPTRRARARRSGASGSSSRSSAPRRLRRRPTRARSRSRRRARSPGRSAS
jgi:hypothetical protein